LDSQRAALAATMSSGKQQLFAKYAEELSQSDYMPVHESIPLGGGIDSITVSTWNVLEFPRLSAAQPVFDGVRPVCDMLLKALGRKSAECQQLLVEAVGSEPVISHHIERVTSFVRDALETRGADVVLLQDVRDRLSEICGSSGWAAHFSQKCDDPKKCNAITAVIAKGPFDEVAEIEVQRQSKIRRFAAARRGSVWAVSCHLPLAAAPREKLQESDRGGNFESRVVKQLWDQCGQGRSNGSRAAVVAGGDWNHPLDEVIGLASASRPEGCTSVSLHAPSCESTLHDYCSGESTIPIDGFLCLR